MTDNRIVDSEAIIQARLRGYSVRAIAKSLRCTIDDVNDALDRFASITLSEKTRSHALALELERLDDLTRVFEQQARDGDIQSALLIAKLIERRSVLLGLAAPPQQHHVIEMQAAPVVTSTQKIRASIERIRGLPKPDPESEPEPEPDNGKAN